MEQVKSFRNKLGRLYREGKVEGENSATVKKHYDTIVKVNKELYNMIPFKVVPFEGEPYKNAKEMRERVVREGIMYISTDGEPNEFMTQEENFIGRAIHDCFAHMVCGCPFTFEGEYNAYLEQRKYYPKEVWGTLFAEIPMQTASYYYGMNFDYEQRAFEAPIELMEEAEKLLVRDYSHNSVITFLKQK